MQIAQMLDTLNWGGAQQMQLFLAETLRPLGVDLTVISLSESSASPVVKKLEDVGVLVLTFPFPKLFSLGSFLKLANFMRAEKFDLLHTYLTHSNIIGPLAGILTGTPTIASLRSADFSFKSYTPQRAFLETFSLRYLATRVMANGEAVAQFARQRVKNRRQVDIVPNAVDLVPPIPEAEREELRRKLTGYSKRPLVLSVGRLTPAKGFDDLLEAFATVREHIPSAALVIAGGGGMLDEFNAQIRGLSLEGHVFMLGARTDVPRLLAVADIYVNSSHWEGTPVSVLEAMAAGLPIVGTSVGENPYLLADGSGMLVPPQQPRALASALVSLLNSPERRAKMGEAARGRIRHYYSREIWRVNLLKLYAQVTPKAKPYLAQVLANSQQASEV